MGFVWVQISSQDVTMGEGRRRGYNDFSLRMSSSLSKRWVCCVVENLSRIFLSEWPFIILWVMRVYIVWVKSKKVILSYDFCHNIFVGLFHDKSVVITLFISLYFCGILLYWV